MHSTCFGGKVFDSDSIFFLASDIFFSISDAGLDNETACFVFEELTWGDIIARFISSDPHTGQDNILVFSNLSKASTLSNQLLKVWSLLHLRL